MTPPSTDQRESGIERWSSAGMIVVVAVFCAATLAQEFENAGSLWHGVGHDRNGHYQSGLDLALALRSFDFPRALALLEQARIWPPVHDLVLATVLLIGGPDHRLGILPSLMGWAATVMLAWFIACRLFADPIARVTAGAVAATFTLASPAFRLLAADVMLEDLGAALTALSLYAYLHCAAAPGDARRWRVLALVLTVLFFEKSNYWEMTAASLALAFFVEYWRSLRRPAFSGVARELPGLARHALRDPLILGFLAVLAAVAAIYVHGPLAIEAFGRRLSLYPPENLVTVAYALMFWRVVLAWRGHRAACDEWLGIPGRAVFYWHILPIAVSFLLPKRLSAFLWYVGPNNIPSKSPYDPWAAAQFQWTGFAEGFHVAPWAGLLALILAAIGAARLPRLAPGGRAVAILALVSALAVIFHPQQGWRFQASWLFALWICAGVGAATLLGWLTSSLPARARLVATAGVIAVLAAAQAIEPTSPTAYAAADHPAAGPSDLDLAAVYLPLLRAGEPVAFVGSLDRNAFVVWTVRERCRCRAIVEQPWVGLATSRDEAQRLTADWLASTPAGQIVVIHPPNTAEGQTFGPERMAGVMDAMKSQQRFARGARILVPSYPAEVTVWELRSGARNP